MARAAVRSRLGQHARGTQRCRGAGDGRPGLLDGAAALMAAAGSLAQTRGTETPARAAPTGSPAQKGQELLLVSMQWGPAPRGALLASR
ncbi:unnamed protein product, partial [Prorocentrum cordatum]